MGKRSLVLVPLLALAFAAGCGSSGGGGGGSSADAASIVPADAQVFATVDTDQGSDQLTSAQTVLDKFPIKQKLEAELTQAATKNGLRFQQIVSTVGPVLDVAVLKTGTTTGVVGFAKPSDEQAFVGQLKNVVHTTVSGWTVFAQSQALLDAVTSRTSSLADDATYKAAIGSIPGTGDAIARLYAPGTALKTATSIAGSSAAAGSLKALAQGSTPDWITAALTSAKGGSFKLELHVKQPSGAPTAGASLADQIPSGVLAALSISGGSLKALPAGTETQLGSLTQSLGIDVQALIGILNGPVILYVKQGTPIPEVTIAAKPPDAAGASAAIRGLVTKLVLKNGGSIKKVTIGGVELNSVNVGPIALYWGTFNGELVVTDNPSALSSLKNGPSSKLTDDSTFKNAADAAGLPDGNQGFLYLDLKDTLPMVEGIATLASQQLPPSVETNLAPLKTLLAYADREGQVQSAVLELQTN
jgi:hypothetical protein